MGNMEVGTVLFEHFTSPHTLYRVRVWVLFPEFSSPLSVSGEETDWGWFGSFCRGRAHCLRTDYSKEMFM